MAPRKSTKTTENPTEQITAALDAPVNLEWSATAEKLNIPVPELQERIAAKLNDSTVFTWENFPAEHEPLVEAIARDLDAERSTRKLEPQAEIPQLSAQPEPPVIEEEPKTAKHSKRKSSALTQKKTKAIEKGREATQQTQQGVKETLVRLQAQAGIKDAANAGTVYLQAFQGTLNQVKGQGLTVIAAEMIRDLSADSDFNPDDILQDLGVSLSPDTQQALLQQLTPVLGKSQEATQEILETAWGNGIDLQAELSQLNSLMNYED